MISVSSVIAENYWKITVTDNGPGFSEEACQKIAQNLAKADQNPGLPELKINGLGTVNVYLRWKIFCNGKIIFEYGNTEDGHGIVSIGRYISEGQETTQY